MLRKGSLLALAMLALGITGWAAASEDDAGLRPASFLADKPAAAAAASAAATAPAACTVCPNCGGQCCCGDDCGHGSGCRGLGTMLEGALGRMDDGSDRLSIWAWTAPAYVSFTGASLWGMDEGVTIGYRLSDHLGLIASSDFWETGANSTQFMGTVGVQRFGDPNGGTLADRTSVWLLWDQFTGLQRQNSVYSSQLRLSVGVASDDNSETGMSFATNAGGFAGGAPLSPLGGPSNLSTGSSFIGPYNKQDMGDYRVTTAVGWVQSADNVAVGVGADRSIGGNLNVFMDTKYGFAGSWSVSAGLEIGLLRADTKHY